MSENGAVCMLGKFHNVLYVAAKLCFDWDFDDNIVISRILNDIFYCEKTFERLFIGAIFGTRVTHFLSGWKSDFEDREECVRALIYFMNHAVTGQLMYHSSVTSEKRRFFDIEMESYGRMMPLRVAVQHGTPDMLLILLRYGATCDSDNYTTTPIEGILQKLKDCESKYEKREPNPNLLVCLKLLLRTVPTVYVKTPAHVAEQLGVFKVPLYEQFPQFVETNIVPPERSGVYPAELKHLCRCRIRQILHDNWALPHGVRLLDVPKTLQDYLDLLHD